jgi:hypothetical protein
MDHLYLVTFLLMCYLTGEINHSRVESIDRIEGYRHRTQTPLASILQRVLILDLLALVAMILCRSLPTFGLMWTAITLLLNLLWLGLTVMPQFQSTIQMHFNLHLWAILPIAFGCYRSEKEEEETLDPGNGGMAKWSFKPNPGVGGEVLVPPAGVSVTPAGS